MLKLEHTTIKFGGLTAVNDLCIEIRKGQIFGLIGPNGAGKTTAFNVITGVYAPTSGKVIYNGEEIQGKRPYYVTAKGISRTYQNINLFRNMTVSDNVMIGTHTRTKSNLLSDVFNTAGKRKEERQAYGRCMEILDFMGIADKAPSKAGSLSYGEQRKLEIARALAVEPKMLLLDEPAAGMNLTEKDELADLIGKIRNLDITILLVEHNMKLVMNVCEEICVLNYGKKLAQGTPSEIQTNPDVIKAYLGGVTHG